MMMTKTDQRRLFVALSHNRVLEAYFQNYIGAGYMLCYLPAINRSVTVHQSIVRKTYREAFLQTLNLQNAETVTEFERGKKGDNTPSFRYETINLGGEKVQEVQAIHFKTELFDTYLRLN
jgi:hypothetical protein